MARRESKRVMVLRGRRARKARNAFTLCVLLPARHTHHALQLFLPWVQLQMLHACHCLMLHAASHRRHSNIIWPCSLCLIMYTKRITARHKNWTYTHTQAHTRSAAIRTLCASILCWIDQNTCDSSSRTIIEMSFRHLRDQEKSPESAVGAWTLVQQTHQTRKQAGTLCSLPEPCTGQRCSRHC